MNLDGSEREIGIWSGSSEREGVREKREEEEGGERKLTSSFFLTFCLSFSEGCCSISFSADFFVGFFAGFKASFSVA